MLAQDRNGNLTWMCRDGTIRSYAVAGSSESASVADRSRKYEYPLDLKLLEEARPPHSNTRARIPGAPHARAVGAMAGFLPSGADTAPLSPPPEPPAAEGHEGGADHDDNNDNNTFSPLVDLAERFPELFAQKVLAHLDPIDRTFLVY